ncbi:MULTISPECIES: TetR/AcrR family transcriptional regulator [Achromobacter]|uniref:TetR family transcriptional regulator n=1 Tax=Achromobacter spanius TaxID=217203 RepID=A0AAW3I0W9_9BURK|nr:MULTISPECIES: TetR/AcrR family transcriptional regulator [Achromobacter]AZS82304.1 TetR/AcrR family transcriptional regulator [Achromobacter spanius]KNE26306.1 TetR family transcriptional regulator [Achromobacter spanius]MCD0496455.1 TetR/AcrR family transcriptional regulator [Achromobacter sp. MY14]MCW3151084.1 TetR/AcrR family transcriptional regulator [Achromobacter spanius]
MTAGTDTAKTGKSELTFAAIVDASLDMAATQGMESLSLGQVAKRLGISKSGVFSRVGSLEALQQAVLDEYDRRFVAAVFTPAMAHPRGLPRLNALVSLWVERASNVELATGCVYVAGAFEYDDVESPLRTVLEGNLRRWRSAMVRTVRQALEAGHLRPDTDPEQLVFEVYSLMIGLMHDARFLRDPKAPARVRAAYDRLISTYRSFTYLE